MNEIIELVETMEMITTARGRRCYLRHALFCRAGLKRLWEVQRYKGTVKVSDNRIPLAVRF